MLMKRVIMVLSASLEFEKGSNPEIRERPTDNIEVPKVCLIVFYKICLLFKLIELFKLMKDLPDFQDKMREAPFSYGYCVKARALIYAHLLRIPLNPETLLKGSFLKILYFILQNRV